MRITVLADGRTYEGTPLEIVQQMQHRAFVMQGASIRDYMRWLVHQAEQFEGVMLGPLPGDSDEGDAGVLLRGMVHFGLCTVNPRAAST